MFEEQAKEYEERKHHRYEDNDYCGDIADGIIQAYQQGAEFGYNKCKEELNHKGLALQSDMDKTIEQNIALKKELNKSNEWHYAKDELPSEDSLLLCVRGGRVCITWYYNGVYHDSRYRQIKKPYAWKEIILPGQEG